MKKEVITSYSSILNRNMTIRIFGEDCGVPFLVFACQDGSNTNWEDFHMQETIGDYIESGRIQLYCVDSVDKESWSDKDGDKGHRASMQDCFFQYAVNEVVPFIREHCHTDGRIALTGNSMGAYHCVNFILRHPDCFDSCIALAGVYDLRRVVGNYWDQNVYFNSPVDYLPNLNDEWFLERLRDTKIIICTGQGAWECPDDSKRMAEIFAAKDIPAWVDLWGYDVNHDWPWWKIMLPHFLPYILD